MDPYWIIYPSLEVSEHHLRLARGRKPKIDILNRVVIHDRIDRERKHSPQSMCGELPIKSWRDLPAPQLYVADPAFGPNLFHDGLMFASEALRNVLGLSNADVFYGDVDTKDCPASTRAQSYKTLNALRCYDVIDRDRSDGYWSQQVGLDGLATRMWKVDGPPAPHAPAPLVVVREDATPPAPIFNVPTYGMPVVTDDLAERVLRSGITDIMFIRLQQERGQTEIAYKTRQPAFA